MNIMYIVGKYFLILVVDLNGALEKLEISDNMLPNVAMLKMNMA